MLVCSAYLHAYELTCLRACLFYVLTCSHVLHACCGQISYVLTCLHAWVHVCPTCFISEKLNSKNSCTEKSVYIQRSIQNPLQHL